MAVPTNRARRAPDFPSKVERTYRNRRQLRNLRRHRRLMAALQPVLDRFADDIDRTGLGEEGLRGDADPASVLAGLLRVVSVTSADWEDEAEPDADELRGLVRLLALFTGRQIRIGAPRARCGPAPEDYVAGAW